MEALNAGPAAAMPEFRVRAATDVTGYGLLGHALNIMEASGTTARFSLGKIPVLDAARPLAGRGIAPGGSRKNFRNLRPRTAWTAPWSDDAFLLLADAQTSGGLLVCVPGGRGEEYAARCRSAGASAAAVVGSVEPRGELPLAVGP
jgi:selenide,water dikinase